MEYAISFIWTLIAVGDLVFLIIFFYRYQRVKASRAWLETVGKITEARIRIDEVTESSGIMEFSYASFTFAYQVSGSELHGSYRIAPGFRLIFQRDLLAKALAKHPVGSDFRVRYNPEDPMEYITDNNKNDHLDILGGMVVWTLLLLLFILVGSFSG